MRLSASSHERSGKITFVYPDSAISTDYPDKNVSYGNLTLTQTYDTQYRLSSIVSGSVLNFTYTYDANGNITSITDSVNPPRANAPGIPGTYILLRQTSTGKVVLWFMNADGTRASYVTLYTDLDCAVAGTGYFN